jgi:hypothetical protein
LDIKDDEPEPEYGNAWLKKRSDKEIKEEDDYWQITDLMDALHKELYITKEKITDLIDSCGFDAAHFDVDIDLKVKFGESTVRVKEAWKRMES